MRRLNPSSPVSTSILLILSTCFSPACQAEESGCKAAKSQVAYGKVPSGCEESELDNCGWARAKVVIKAPANTVWNTVHEERKRDPDIAYSKLLEHSGNECTLEQKFVFLPVVGSAVCVMKQNEIPLRRIDYHLIKSDHFKALEGSWVLTPSLDGKSTILTLSSHVDLGLPVPIPAGVFNGILTKKIQRRLKHVKLMAESTSAKVAETSFVR